jgi:hypothetical protein
MVEFWIDTLIISTILLYFFKNFSLLMLFTYKGSFFKFFPKLLKFLMGDNLLSFSLRQSFFNSYRDLDSNSYSTEVVSLMMVMLSVQSPTLRDAQG